MSEQVKRYDYGYKDDGCGGDRYLGLIEKPDGALVRHSDYAALEAECDKLRAQVSALQSDANSWQSGYDKGREDGAKAADGWKAQHARDSAELRRLCAERDALHAEAEAMRVVLHEIASVNPAERGIEWAKAYASDGLKGAGSDLYSRWLEAFRETEALRAENGRLKREAENDAVAYRAVIERQEQFREERDSFQLVGIRAMEELESVRGVLGQAHMALIGYLPGHRNGITTAAIDACAKALASQKPEVPDHTENVLEMAEQGERQEAVCWVPRACLDKLRNGRNNSPSVLTDGPAEFNDTPLYTIPQPSQDVRSLVEALEECAASLAWNCFGECRAVHAGPIMPAAKALDTARAALSAHRQAQRQ